MDTKTSLLDSAESAVRQRGYSGFSYADLSREIGIRKASIHHHFPTKAMLGQSLIERYAARFFERLSEIKQAKRTAAEDLLAYVDIYRDALNDGTEVCLCVSLSAGRDHLSDEILAQLDQFHQTSLSWLEATFAQAQGDQSVRLDQPKAEAHALLALMEGAQLLARASKSIALFDQSTAAFRARLTCNIPQSEA